MCVPLLCPLEQRIYIFSHRKWHCGGSSSRNRRPMSNNSLHGLVLYRFQFLPNNGRRCADPIPFYLFSFYFLHKNIRTVCEVPVSTTTKKSQSTVRIKLNDWVRFGSIICAGRMREYWSSRISGNNVSYTRNEMDFIETICTHTQCVHTVEWVEQSIDHRNRAQCSSCCRKDRKQFSRKKGDEHRAVNLKLKFIAE